MPVSGNAQTDGSGYVQIVMDAFRGNHYGITVYKDADGSATPTTGEMVWGGDGTSSVTYFTYPTLTRPIDNSIAILIADWAAYGTDNGAPPGAY